jgi:hypothetical protein
MSRYALVIAICVTLPYASPSFADIAGVTADGTWDCKDAKGTNAGTIVLAEKTYALIKADGKLGGYGKVFQMGFEAFDLPGFVIVDGPLKDDVHSAGFGMRGPRDNPHKLDGELFLNVVLSAGGKDDWDCRRRKAP